VSRIVNNNVLCQLAVDILLNSRIVSRAECDHLAWSPYWSLDVLVLSTY
jgi:hypothetical protein